MPIFGPPVAASFVATAPAATTLPAAAPPDEAPPAEAAPLPAAPVLPGDAGVRAYASAQSHSRDALQAALDRHQGNQTRAAQSLGLTLRQFGYRLRKAGLK